jgi:DDE superfamily endonuclease
MGKALRSKVEKKLGALLQMDISILQQFRHEIYASFRRAKDALFDTIDALIGETQAQSFPELSLSPFFQRRWHSLYEAFQDGKIDHHRLQHVFLKYLPTPAKRLVLGIDATHIERPCSQTSPDRTAMPIHNIPHTTPKKSTAITFGWQYSTVTVLPENPSSWTSILDQKRIPSDKTDIQVAIEQLKEIVPQLSERPLVLLDRGYVSLWLWCQLSGLAIDALGRLKCNQVFYKPAPPHTGKKGQPRKDGAKLKLDDSSTHKSPDGTWDGIDAKGHPVQVRWWKKMHCKDARWLDLTVIEVIRPQAQGSERDPRSSWFVYIGQDPQEGIAQVALLYCLRFGQEHGYRFDKQALLWTEPRLRTPEQFDRWSQIVAIVHNLIVVARDFVEAELRPWENKQREQTPQQVRRGLAKFLAQLGTPARPPKPRGKSKGRSCGTQVRKAQRFPVVRKTAKIPQLVPT